MANQVEKDTDYMKDGVVTLTVKVGDAYTTTEMTVQEMRRISEITGVDPLASCFNKQITDMVNFLKDQEEAINQPAVEEVKDMEVVEDEAN